MRGCGTTFCILLLIGRVLFIYTNQIVNTNIYIKGNGSYEYQSYK